MRELPEPVVSSADGGTAVLRGWNNVDVYDGSDTGLARSYEVEQTWGRNQDDYLNRNSGMLRLSELWYRHHEDGYVLVLANGKAVEYREDNPYHYAAVAQGRDAR